MWLSYYQEIGKPVFGLVSTAAAAFEYIHKYG